MKNVVLEELKKDEIYKKKVFTKKKVNSTINKASIPFVVDNE